jgi:hypothetical protein
MQATMTTAEQVAAWLWARGLGHAEVLAYEVPNRWVDRQSRAELAEWHRRLGERRRPRRRKQR